MMMTSLDFWVVSLGALRGVNKLKNSVLVCAVGYDVDEGIRFCVLRSLTTGAEVVFDRVDPVGSGAPRSIQAS